MTPRTERSPIRYWNYFALFLVLSVVSWRALSALEYRKLAERLGYSGPSERFPISHFRTVAANGSDAQQVWARIRGFDRVTYFLLPFVDGSDTLTVQRFTYPLVTGALDVDVRDLRGRVHDVEVGGYGNRGIRSISATQAYERLGWHPPQ